MRPSSVRSLASLVLRAVVAVLFGVAAILKLREPAALVEQIANYRLLPELANTIAVVLPGVELVGALGLVLGPRAWRCGAALLLSALLLVFTSAIVHAWVLGLNLECGCFGSGSTRVGPWPILRNLGLLAALAVGVALDLRSRDEETRVCAQLS